MSSFSETMDDHVSFSRRSTDKPEDSHVKSLTALTGVYLVKEAYEFFEELQADLSSIEIQGDDVDELWCTLDWLRYILGLWVEQIKKSRGSERKWLDIKESWEVIIQTTVALNLSYAHPSDCHQRPNCKDNTESLGFGKIIYDHRCQYILAEHETSLMKSILQATEEEAWSTPFFHERAFTGLIDSTMDDVAMIRSPVPLHEQRRSGIKSTIFKDFIEVLGKAIRDLIVFSTAEDQEEIYMALHRALRTALLRSDDNVDTKIRYLKFYHSLLSTRPFNNDTLKIGIEWIFQSRVQGLFGDLISCSFDSSKPESFPYTVKNLEDTLALGGDVRGLVELRENCSLWIAARSNNYQFFKALVHAGAPYTMESTFDRTPLHAAAEAGNLDIVAFLLSSEQQYLRIDINQGDSRGRTALHEAAENGSESVIKLLLQQPGIDANAIDYGQQTPFRLALWAKTNRSKKYACIGIFLRNERVDCNIKTNNSANALHIAAMSKDVTLKTIIRHIKGINDQDERGATPLHLAVEFNSKPNVDILLSHGADPTVSDKNGFTPLLLAFQKRHLGPLELLLSLPGSLKHLSPELIGGLQRRCHPHCSPVTLVLFDYEYVTKRTRADLIRVLRTILATKPDLEMRNDIGQSVLNYAIEAGDENAVLELLQAGADVNSQDHDGRTPLHRLMRSKRCPDPDKVELLLEWGADISLEEKNGHAAFTADWVSSDWVYPEVASRYKKFWKNIENRKREKARQQQQKNLHVLAEQTKAYVEKQKQRETMRKRPQASSNPFAILQVEGMESPEDDLVKDTLNGANV